MENGYSLKGSEAIHQLFGILVAPRPPKAPDALASWLPQLYS